MVMVMMVVTAGDNGDREIAYYSIMVVLMMKASSRTLK